ncbi:thioredoxin-like protein [Entophlyctis helioformis]|nr:thioredoxin-like protein [Entophlyctis helioformis]
MTQDTSARGLRLGDVAPDFAAETTQGDISFHEWKAGSWAILFSHPEDFTPVCTTELGAVAKLSAEWAKRGVKPIGLSCNTLESHGRWIDDINETQGSDVKFPIIADFDRKVASKTPPTSDRSGLPLTVRSVFIVDPNHKIRLIITYPASTGRNFDEVLRVIDSLQLTDKHSVTTPVNWQPKDDVIIPPSINDEAAQKRFPGFRTVKPYLRYTADPSINA